MHDFLFTQRDSLNKKKQKKNYKTQQYLCGFLSQISPIGSKEIKALKGQNLEMLFLL